MNRRTMFGMVPAAIVALSEMRQAKAGPKADLCQTCNGNGSCASGNCVNGICKPGVDPCAGKTRSFFRCGNRTAYCCHFKGEPLSKCRQVTA